MKTKLKSFSTLAALMAGVFITGTAGGLAQNERDASQQQQQKSERDKQDLKVSPQEAQQQVTDANKASKLIGMHVKNKQDEDLGKIKDLVVDFQAGKVAYAVLSSGGTLGFGGKMVAIPFEALTLQPGAKAVVVDLEKQQLAQAPGFNEDNWPDLNAAETGKTVGLAPTKSPREATGGTGSQAEQTRGSGSITNLQQLSSSADMSKLEGQQVRIQSAKVDKAIGQDLLCVSSESGQKVLVKTQRPVRNLQPGQSVQVQGTARKMPSDPAQLGLEEETLNEFKDQKVYIQATQVTPAQQ